MKPTNAGNTRDASLIPGEENGSSSTPVFLPENIHGQKSLAGYSPWGRKEFGHNWAHTRMCTHTQWCQTKSTFMRFSYLSSKWVIKQWRQLGTATVHLTQELLTNIQCSGGSWSFVKETRALKNRVVASHRKVTATNWEQSLKLILLKLHKKLPKNSTLTILQSFSIWSKLKRWKNSISGSSWADRKFKKSSFWSVVFSYSMQQQQQQTISQSDHDVWWKVDFIQHSAMTSSVVGQRRSKALPKAKFAPKKGHGHCLVVCCPSDPLQLSESWWNHYIWEVCSAKLMRCTENYNTYNQHPSTERAQFSMTTPDHVLYNQPFTSWRNWATKFCLICHIHLTSHQLTTSSSSILTTFYRENTSTATRRQTMLSKSL